MDTPKYQEAVRRAALPEVLFAPDLSVALAIPVEDTDRSAREGRFGPFFFVQGRVAVLRKDFLSFLASRAANRDASRKEVLP